MNIKQRLTDTFFKKNIKSMNFKSQSHASYEGTYIWNGAKMISMQEVKEQKIAYQLESNTTLQKLINRQISIAQSFVLEAKELKQGKDSISENKAVKKFIACLETPSTALSPQTWEELLGIIYKRYSFTGISGFVMSFQGEESDVDMYKNIEVPYIITYTNPKGFGFGSEYYECQLRSQSTVIKFLYNENLSTDKHRIYTTIPKDGEDLKCLFLLQNFDIYKNCFTSPFEPISTYTKQQNFINIYSEHFYQNFGSPVSFIVVNATPTKADTDIDNDSVKEALDKIIINSKGKITSGTHQMATLGCADAILDIKVVPLPMGTNQMETIEMQKFLSQQIYSFVDGGSYNFFEGQSEYANNADSKKKEFYDGTLRIFENLILEKLTKFMQCILQNEPNIDNIYLTFNTEKVQVFRDAEIQKVSEMYTKNGLTLDQFQNKISTIAPESFGDILPSGDNRYYSEIGKTSLIDNGNL